MTKKRMKAEFSSAGCLQPRWPGEVFVFLLALTLAGPIFSQSIRFEIADAEQNRSRQARWELASVTTAGQEMGNKSAATLGPVSVPSLGLVALDQEVFQILGTQRSPALFKSSIHGPSFRRARGPNERGSVGRIAGAGILAVSGRTVISRLSPNKVQVGFLQQDWSHEIELPEGIELTALSPNGNRIIVVSGDHSRIMLYQVESGSVSQLRAYALSTAGAKVVSASVDNRGQMIGFLAHTGSASELYVSRDEIGFQPVGSFPHATRLSVDPGGRFLSVVDLEAERLYQYRPSSVGFVLSDTWSFGADALKNPLPVEINGKGALVGLHDGRITVCIGPGECSMGSIHASEISEVIPVASNGNFIARIGTEGRQLAAISAGEGRPVRTNTVAVQPQTLRRSAGTRLPTQGK